MLIQKVREAMRQVEMERVRRLIQHWPVKEQAAYLIGYQESIRFQGELLKYSLPAARQN